MFGNLSFGENSVFDTWPQIGASLYWLTHIHYPDSDENVKASTCIRIKTSFHTIYAFYFQPIFLLLIQEDTTILD